METICTFWVSLPEPDQVSCDTVQKASEQEKEALIDKVDAFIFDCDGESST